MLLKWFNAVHRFICPPIFLSVSAHRFIQNNICLDIWKVYIRVTYLPISVYLSICLSICLSTLSLSLYLYLVSRSPSVCPLVYIWVKVHLITFSIYISIYVSIYPSMDLSNQSISHLYLCLWTCHFNSFYLLNYIHAPSTCSNILHIQCFYLSLCPAACSPMCRRLCLFV